LVRSAGSVPEEAMPSKPIDSADIAQLMSLVAKARLKLGLPKGSPEVQALAAQIVALQDEFEDEDALVRFVVADKRRSSFRIVKG
jgi:hypothetical protein